MFTVVQWVILGSKIFVATIMPFMCAHNLQMVANYIMCIYTYL